jgi:hypothetical protein
MFMYNDFSKNLIKEYKYWKICAHKNQNYLWHCIVWCKRDDALSSADTKPEEK